MSCCGLTNYGRREWLIATVAMAILAAMAVWAAGRGYWIAAAAVVLPLAVWIWVLWFFRDPQRICLEDEGAFTSPADGTVTNITQLGADSPLGRSGVQVGIFMSVFDVHVNRSPASAVVTRVEHKPGTFLDARDVGAREGNESAWTFLTCRVGGVEYPVIVRQVAGLIARRIVTDLSAGQELSRGQRIGMIKFGSRAELMIPTELAGEVRVKVGQHVLAGLTVLIAPPAKGT